MKNKKELVEAIMNKADLNEDDVSTVSGNAGIKKTGMQKLLNKLRDADGQDQNYREHIEENYSPGT